MRIEIDIPDWAAEDSLYLITRSELIAKKIVGEDWEIKDIRCNKCGKCCESHPKDGAYFPLDEHGACVHLTADGDYKICGLGMNKLLACVLGEPEGSEYTKFGCCIEYK